MSNTGWMNTTKRKAQKYSDPSSSHNFFHEQWQNCYAKQRPSVGFLLWAFPTISLSTFSVLYGQPHHRCHLSMMPPASLLWQLPGTGVPPLIHTDKSGCKMKSTPAQLAWPFPRPLSSDWCDLRGFPRMGGTLSQMNVMLENLPGRARPDLSSLLWMLGIKPRGLIPKPISLWKGSLWCQWILEQAFDAFW